MSSAGRKGVARRAFDFYPTPSWAVRRLLDNHSICDGGGRFLEPCAGDGAIIRAVPRMGIEWTAVEIQRHAYLPLSRLAPHVYISDYIEWARQYHEGCWKMGFEPFDVIITNPPYNLAREVIDASLCIARKCAFLLRLNFLGSESRAAWLRSFDAPPDIFVLPNRVSGTGDGKTDSTEYAWFVWESGRDHRPGYWDILPSTPLSERQRDYR